MRRFTFRSLALATLLLGSLPASAADVNPAPTAAVSDELAQARALIDRKDWPTAVERLKVYTRANPASADGYNLLGYSYRHLQRYNESLDAYLRALALDPKHRGAHEYIGETYLALGRLDMAK